MCVYLCQTRLEFQLPAMEQAVAVDISGPGCWYVTLYCEYQYSIQKVALANSTAATD